MILDPPLHRTQGFKSGGSDETEQKLLAVLLHACTRELQTLGSSITEDTRLLSEATDAADLVAATMEGGSSSSSSGSSTSKGNGSSNSKGSSASSSSGGRGFGAADSKEGSGGKGKGGSGAVSSAGKGQSGGAGVGVITLEPGGGLRIRERMAILFRLEKKRVLAACCRSLGAEVCDSTGTSVAQAGALAVVASPGLE